MPVIRADACEVFPIANASLYDCQVFRFLISHSVLDIRFWNSNNLKTPSRFITFLMVEYFSGPIRWKGIDFKMEPNQSSFQFVQKNIERFENFDQEQFDDFGLRLYVIKQPNLDIKIVAHKVVYVWEQADLENQQKLFEEA